ncbi:MAG: magnesium/cobalt transporter CorA [Opitutaceae bacterium]|nr:magnesium/cobalt transporter CorA [Opitutaceae bacterium]
MIRSFIFSEGKLAGRDLELEALRIVRADKGLHLWVDLENPTDEEIKQVLEGVFGFHPLAIEDCVTPSSLPKIEDYEDYLFIVTHAVDFTRTEKFNTTELDLFLGKEFLVTFHRKALRSIDALVEKINRATGVIARGPDRIAHTILDNLVDLFKPVTDELRAEIEEIEARILAESSDTLLTSLLEVRSEVAHLRQIIRPQRDVINRLAHGETKIIRAIMQPYYRDLRDNLLRIEQTAAGFADELLVSFDLYLNKSASQTNDGIKVLTALTAITLPPIVIGTWYGMNFQHIPEIASPAGYWVALGVMLASTGAMFLWCKRRGWI